MGVMELQKSQAPISFLIGACEIEIEKFFIELLLQLINQFDGCIRFDVEAIVFHDAVFADDDGPWGASGFEA